MFATIRPATRHDLPAIYDLLQAGAQRQLHCGREDIAAFVDKGGVLVGLAAGQLHGTLLVDVETRPPTLPPTAPDRLFVRGLAVRRGLSPSVALRELLAPLLTHPAPQPRLLIAHGGYSWYDRSLLYADFALVERVRFMELDNVARRLRNLGAAAPLVTLRAGEFADLETLAALDAAAFAPIWHFSAAALRPLALQGRLQTGWCDEQLVAYSLTTFNGALAHVARLAVHPQWQGRGIGRQLMVDVLGATVSAGCARAVLNTQTDNLPAQRLYRSLGFRPTDEDFGVFTKALPPAPV